MRNFLRKHGIASGVLFFILVILFYGAHIDGARAEQVCLPHKEMAKRLIVAWDEVPVAMGLATNGSVLEVFASPIGTWTIVATAPDGTACALNSGEAWTTFAVGEPI